MWLGQGGQYFLVRRVATRLELGVDECPVGSYLKTPATGRNHLDFDSLNLAPERSRQTGGLWFVVSSSAVFDRYYHS